jgi:molybdopterin synthase sulfur carrier subunit
MATIIIPTPLRKYVAHKTSVDVNATTVAEAIQTLSTDFPEIKRHLVDEQGHIRSFLNIFVGEDDFRDLQLGETQLSETSVVSIIPAIAGGAFFN